MLMFGNVEMMRNYVINNPKSNLLVLNFSSLAQDYEFVDLLPRERFNLDDSQEFDVAFANYIFSDDYRFIQFMKIIYPLYEGIDVFVLVTRSEFYDILNESLAKLIQQRYGYIYNDIFEIGDLEYLSSGSFSIQGLYNLDMDKQRLISNEMK